jgi:hypothetical protein
MCADNKYDQIKHVEFIQNAITRMASNSFMCKGWAVTLFAAIMVIDGTVRYHLSETLPLLVIVMLIAFWSRILYDDEQETGDRLRSQGDDPDQNEHTVCQRL